VLAVRGQKILRMVTIQGFLIRKDLYRVRIIFKKLKHENVIKMKNKPYQALLRPSNLSNKIKKRVPKSRETHVLVRALYLLLLYFLKYFSKVWSVNTCLGTGPGPSFANFAAQTLNFSMAGLLPETVTGSEDTIEMQVRISVCEFLDGKQDFQPLSLTKILFERKMLFGCCVSFFRGGGGSKA
jgi:hypothetical protein